MSETDDQLKLELAKFVIATWDSYCDDPSLEVEALISTSDLFEEVEVEEEDDDNNVGDVTYQLSDLGKQALILVQNNK